MASRGPSLPPRLPASLPDSTLVCFDLCGRYALDVTDFWLASAARGILLYRQVIVFNLVLSVN